MSERIKVIAVDQIAPGQRKLVKVRGNEIALFNLEGKFYAVDNRCPHSTGPLVEGRLYHNLVTCPWHGYRFDIRTGRSADGRALALRRAPNVVVEEAEGRSVSLVWPD